MNAMPQVGLGPELKRIAAEDAREARPPIQVSPAQYGHEPQKRAVALAMATALKIQEIMRQETVPGVAEVQLFHDFQSAIADYHSTITGEPPEEPVDVRVLQAKIDTLTIEIEAMKALKARGRMIEQQPPAADG